MISLSLQLSPDSRKLLEKLAKAVPDATRRAFFRAAGIVRRKMAARMNPRRRQVEPWAAVTEQIRNLSRDESAATFGGRLMHPRGRQIAVKPLPGGGATVGWVGGLVAAALRFQQGGAKATTSSFRRYLYTRGIDAALVPFISSTPARPVVDPVALEAQQKLPGWTVGALKKILARQIRLDALRYDAAPGSREGAAAAERVAAAYDALDFIQSEGL